MTAGTPLSRDRILRCAVALADRDGLDAASLRKVAAELGVHVTSLYHHVATKEALLDGLVEELFVSADLPLGEMPWEQWVREFVAAVAAMARAHPGAFEVMLRRPVQGPHAAATFEAGLAAFRATGLDLAGAYAAVKAVSLSVLGVCIEQASGAAGEQLSTDIAQLSDRDFPLTRGLTAVEDEVDVVAEISEVLVAGFAARLRRR